MKRVRVLVVDDSATMRRLLTEILSADPEIEVIGGAPEPAIARTMIKELNPDVITLDVEMPHMNGLEFLEKIMRLRPMPVVMVSALTQRGAEVTLEALELGAVDYFAKPKENAFALLASSSTELAEKVKTAARANVRARRRFEISPIVKTCTAISSRHRYRCYWLVHRRRRSPHRGSVEFSRELPADIDHAAYAGRISPRALPIVSIGCAARRDGSHRRRRP
jgi:chemotaxis response regulator CheB